MVPQRVSRVAWLQMRIVGWGIGSADGSVAEVWESGAVVEVEVEADAKGCSGRERDGRCLDTRAAYVDADMGCGRVRRVEAGKTESVFVCGEVGSEERLMRTFVKGCMLRISLALHVPMCVLCIANTKRN
jgi:hypothetical protein